MRQRLPADFEAAEATLAYAPACQLLKGAHETQIVKWVSNRMHQLSEHTIGLKPHSGRQTKQVLQARPSRPGLL